jgi:hypothetical protein
MTTHSMPNYVYSSIHTRSLFTRFTVRQVFVRVAQFAACCLRTRSTGRAERAPTSRRARPISLMPVAVAVLRLLLTMGLPRIEAPLKSTWPRSRRVRPSMLLVSIRTLISSQGLCLYYVPSRVPHRSRLLAGHRFRFQRHRGGSRFGALDCRLAVAVRSHRVFGCVVLGIIGIVVLVTASRLGGQGQRTRRRHCAAERRRRAVLSAAARGRVVELALLLVWSMLPRTNTFIPSVGCY